MPWEISAQGVRYKVYGEGSSQLRLLEFGKDLDHPNWCVTGHIGYVVEGIMEVEFDDQTITLREGDGMYFPAGDRDRHRPKALTDKVRLILVEEA